MAEPAAPRPPARRPHLGCLPEPLGGRACSDLEISADKRQPQDYAEASGSGRLPYDYVWFTPVAEREDPCAKLKERMEHGSHAPPKT